MLAGNVREFVEKNVEGSALSIDEGGISAELAAKLAGQGILGATIPADMGGAGLDRRSYLVVLGELARSSPSLAARVLITNSLFVPLASSASEAGDVLRDVAAGRRNATVAYLGTLEGYAPGLGAEGGRVSGVEEFVLNGRADVVVARVGGKADGLALVRGGTRVAKEHPRLGLRGLSLSSVEFDSRDFTPLRGGGLESMARALEGLDLEIATVSLAIASRALAKAVEYSSAREAFDHPLKDYQPVAFELAALRSEEELLRSFVQRDDLGAADGAICRVRALDLAKRATRQSVQVHGGYGYFEDFGISRFYRDSVAMSILFSRRSLDMERLSGFLYSSRSGFV